MLLGVVAERVEHNRFFIFDWKFFFGKATKQPNKQSNKFFT
jgi:hypothetical protein